MPKYQREALYTGASADFAWPSFWIRGVVSHRSNPHARSGPDQDRADSRFLCRSRRAQAELAGWIKGAIGADVIRQHSMSDSESRTTLSPRLWQHARRTWQCILRPCQISRIPCRSRLAPRTIFALSRHPIRPVTRYWPMVAVSICCAWYSRARAVSRIMASGLYRRAP